MSPSFPAHCVDQLREAERLKGTRPFNARGASLKRCPQCQLGLRHCICEWRVPSQCGIEFVLLMHREELFKPTNTGRLIADLFPKQCHAFSWSRLQPLQALLDILQDPQRHCLLLFPPDERVPRPVVFTPKANTQNDRASNNAKTNDKTPTVIVLDGTWKQARKMANHSRWLAHLPLLDLAPTLHNSELSFGHYQVRQACEEGRLSTLEAAALALIAAEEDDAAIQLLNYFQVFTEHYMATRRNSAPDLNKLPSKPVR